MSDVYLSASEAAKIACVSAKTIVRGIRSNKIVGHQTDKKYYADKESLSKVYRDKDFFNRMSDSVGQNNVGHSRTEEIKALLDRIEYLQRDLSKVNDERARSQNLLVASKEERMKEKDEGEKKVYEEKEKRLKSDNKYQMKLVFKNYLLFTLSLLLIALAGWIYFLTS